MLGQYVPDRKTPKQIELDKVTKIYNKWEQAVAMSHVAIHPEQANAEIAMWKGELIAAIEKTSKV